MNGWDDQRVFLIRAQVTSTCHKSFIFQTYTDSLCSTLAVETVV